VHHDYKYLAKNTAIPAAEDGTQVNTLQDGTQVNTLTTLLLAFRCRGENAEFARSSYCRWPVLSLVAGNASSAIPAAEDGHTLVA
jgi:hypothetical protein